MAHNLRPPDNEFASATGANVKRDGDRSDFDYPPNRTRDLVVTALAEPFDMARFRVGARFGLSWTAPEGARRISVAEVVRSDRSGATQGIVVFEGLDEAGAPAQILYAPKIDLQGWYEGNLAVGKVPQFHNTDRSPAAYEMPCFAAGTRLATPQGLRVVESLQPGDTVLTRDNGAQRVVWSGQASTLGHGHMAPVIFEPGSIGNAQRLVLSQQHRVLMVSAAAWLHFGETEVFVAAKTLVDGGAVRIETWPRITWCHILLAGHDIVLAEGAPCETLYLGDMAMARLGEMRHEIVHLFPALATSGADSGMVLARRALQDYEARLLVRLARPKAA